MISGRTQTIIVCLQFFPADWIQRSRISWPRTRYEITDQFEHFMYSITIYHRMDRENTSHSVITECQSNFLLVLFH